MIAESERNNITDLLRQIAESVRELNAVNYDILRIIDDDWSKLSEQDSHYLMTSIEVAERLMANEKLSEGERIQNSGNINEAGILLAELKEYVKHLKMRRTYYELIQSIGDKNNAVETYAERKLKIEAKRKKLREQRKNNKK